MKGLRHSENISLADFAMLHPSSVSCVERLGRDVSIFVVTCYVTASLQTRGIANISNLVHSTMFAKVLDGGFKSGYSISPVTHTGLSQSV